jgi:hypothetical protein
MQSIIIISSICPAAKSQLFNTYTYGLWLRTSFLSSVIQKNCFAIERNIFWVTFIPLIVSSFVKTKMNQNTDDKVK